MPTSSARYSFIFSCVGHTYIHLFTAFYFVIVLALEAEWGRPYHEMIELWMPGALLVGIAALPAGWLGDRWNARGMMVVFFIGMGGSAIICGLAQGPVVLTIGLTGVGLFAAIYHPVGIAWLIRNTGANRGKVLGINGIFGSAGVAAAAVVASGLIDLIDWRAAFVVPGVISVLTGVALWVCVRKGLIVETKAKAGSPDTVSRKDRLRVFAILLLTMFASAIIFQSTQTALPKMFSGRISDLAGEGAFGVGLYVALVYGVAGLMQLVGGILADKYPLKNVYLGAFLFQIPLLYLAASFTGLPLVVVSMMMVMFSTSALPAENMLLARYAPARHHGLAFGIKFVLAFGSAPLGLMLVSSVYQASGGFYWVFVALAGSAALCLAAAFLLPRETSGEMPIASPAE
ncbi:MAG: MFS transporter [Alphaproteobacteria bacterium]|nr:MFS transporter [Alphaproteobacteria bacterium]